MTSPTPDRAATLRLLAGDPSHDARLTELWETPSNWLARLSTVDHKSLGMRYIVTALVFLILGGLEAELLRLQLARPEGHVLTPEQYNQLFTMHGTTMMFLFIQPVLSGFSFYLTPLMIGARELAFPRLNSFSYFGYLFAGIFLYASFIVGQAPDGGWFNYTPLSSVPYNTGYNIDFYAVGLLLLSVSTTVGAVNSIVTILKLRAPGMSAARMPLFLWSSLTTSVAVVLAMPALTAALLLLELERRWGFAFFDPHWGGTPLLWQHLFWVFGHPWVYIVFLPVTGMLSMIIPVFCRRPMVGHRFVAAATVATGVAGFGVWAHHMFVTGLPDVGVSFFSAGSMIVSLPSAIQMAAWITTIWHGRVVFRTPMLYAMGFIAQFVIGGISGVMTAVVPFDWQAHDTYFVVAHLHYVLAGGSLFGLFAGIYYWYPKAFGRMLDERLGTTSFWIMLAGFNIAFFPMHVAGLMGMTRRVYTYMPGLGLDTMNMLSTIGAVIFMVGVFLTLYNLATSHRTGRPAGNDPWGANSLEWAATSPPAAFNFAHLPVVSGREPLWDGGVTAGEVFDAARMTPQTSSIRARLEGLLVLPPQNLWAVFAAVTLVTLGTGVMIKNVPLIASGVVLTLASIARWMWPVHYHPLETEA